MSVASPPNTNLPILKPGDYASDQDVRWCPGCGDYSILAQTKKVFAKLGLDRVLRQRRADQRVNRRLVHGYSSFVLQSHRNHTRIAARNVPFGASPRCPFFLTAGVVTVAALVIAASTQAWDVHLRGGSRRKRPGPARGTGR